VPHRTSRSVRGRGLAPAHSTAPSNETARGFGSTHHVRKRGATAFCWHPYRRFTAVSNMGRQFQTPAPSQQPLSNSPRPAEFRSGGLRFKKVFRKMRLVTNTGTTQRRSSRSFFFHQQFTKRWLAFPLTLVLYRMSFYGLVSTRATCPGQPNAGTRTSKF